MKIKKLRHKCQSFVVAGNIEISNILEDFYKVVDVYDFITEDLVVLKLDRYRKKKSLNALTLIKKIIDLEVFI
jgi:hypothetical protein